jgi:hypothetical protein
MDSRVPWSTYAKFVFVISCRVLRLAVGLGMIYWSAKSSPGKFLGFYAPTSSMAVGYDLAHILWQAMAVWLIYRGINPKNS